MRSSIRMLALLGDCRLIPRRKDWQRFVVFTAIFYKLNPQTNLTNGIIGKKFKALQMKTDLKRSYNITVTNTRR